MSTATIYQLVFTLYGAIVIIAAVRSRRTTDPAAFWTEDRSVSGLRAGISLSATFMSISWSVVYGIEVFLRYGLKGFYVLSLPWLIVLAIFWYLAPQLRNIPVFSQPELIRSRFGKRSGLLAAVPILLVFTIWGGAEMDVAAKLLAGAAGVPQPLLVVVIGLMIAVYMSFSGTRAVIVTDIIQYLLVALFFLLIILPGWTGGPVRPKLPAGDTPVRPLFILLTFLAYLPGWLAETDIWIRLQITPDGRSARQAMGTAWINGLLFVGLMPLLAAAVVPAGTTDGTAAVTILMNALRHPGLIALAAIGLVAASMSTIDTCINVSAMTLSYDMVLRRSGSRNVTAIWLATAGAVGFALVSDTLKDAFYLSSGILSTTLFLPVLACYLPGVSRRAVIAVLAVAPPVTILFYGLEKTGWLAVSGAQGVFYILPAFAVSLTLFLGLRKTARQEASA